MTFSAAGQHDEVQPVNILIVDDEPKNLAVLEVVLDDPGYRLVRAGSGDEALLALMADEFALLILDVRMPGMSGFEVAHLVKERRKTARIPIIFLTAYYNEDQHILEGYGSGAVDYLHKPVNPSVLRSKVSMFAELHRQGRALEQLNATLDRRVTERTLELEQSEARLLEASRRKDEFLATLAHELRNPLAPVRNAVELLRRHNLEPSKLQWAAELIDRQVRSFSHLIDDLMDVSRINRGRIELRREVVPLGEVLADAVETVRPLVHDCEQELVVVLPDQPMAVDGDRTRLAQIFTNLLNNASKYTDKRGRIELSVTLESEQVVVVTVRDNGIGIPPDRLESVFEMFSQVETAIARSRGGLGIGLSLTQKLVQMHGGSVKAFSEGLGHGSRFQVTLPLCCAEPAPAAAAPQEATAAVPLRILVVDDNRDAAETLAELLSTMGYETRQAHDGESAIELAAAFDPHVVLLDIGLPGLNGYEACRRLREQPGGKARTLVAVTGWGQPEDLRRSREAGFDQHLVKPIDFDAIVDIIAKVPAPAAG